LSQADEKFNKIYMSGFRVVKIKLSEPEQKRDLFMKETIGLILLMPAWQ
jgi:hypothetical protein